MLAGHDFERQDIKPALPNSWRWVTLGEVCVINPSRPSGLQRNDNAPTTFVPMSAADGRLGMITRSEVRPFSEVRKGYTYVAEGDVLFSKITPCMENGKHAIAQALLDGFGFGTTEFHSWPAAAYSNRRSRHRRAKSTTSDRAAAHCSGPE
jgi:hypothetical protein